MLLKHLYDYAISRNLLSDLAFAPKAVRWIIDLDANGKFLGIVQTTAGDDDKRGKEFSCPKTTRAKNAGGVAEFLAADITAVFGLEGNWKEVEKRGRNPDWVKDREKNNADKKSDFWRQMNECERSCSDIAACQKYIASIPVEPPFLRRVGNLWKITPTSGNEITLGPENFTFRVNGNLLIENKKLLDWWQTQYNTEVDAIRTDAERGICIVTGKSNQPIARTHSLKIKGFDDSPPGGAALVSFEKSSKAFSSYGFKEGQNCPTAEDVATAYCAALNHLIKNKDSSLRIGGTVFCFWVEKIESAGNLFSRLLNKPYPQTVHDFMVSPWAGIERELAKKDKFIAVTLKGCAGRVAVSHWLQETLEQAIENLQRWFNDLAIFAPPRQQTNISPLSVYWLSATLPPIRKIMGRYIPDMEKLRSEIPYQLYRAALEDTAPSTALIKPILAQLQSRLLRDDNYNIIFDESRFSLLKLILNRNRKDSDMKIKPILTTDTADAAYNSGRLLAVLAETQRKAHDYKLEGAGVAERYFGIASTSPSSVFPLLLRLNRHHLDKIRKSERYSGHERFLTEQIQSILVRFRPNSDDQQPPDFTRNLDLQAQGRFALGFYQQQADDVVERTARGEFTKARDAAKSAGKSAEDVTAAGETAYQTTRETLIREALTGR
jgi:CRISPR-associated protein Csd1